MYNPFKRPQYVYSMADIEAHQKIITDLYKDRDRTLQQLLLSKNSKDRPTPEYLNLEETLTVITGNIHTAELSLAFMLQRNQKHMEAGK